MTWGQTSFKERVSRRKAGKRYVKKGSGHLFKSKVLRFEFMKEHRREFSIEKMAKVLGVSRFGYYDFLEKPRSDRNLENERLKEAINSLYREIFERVCSQKTELLNIGALM